MKLFPTKKIFVNSSTNTINMASKSTNTLTEEELLAPLASMEDLSVLNTPMTTPGASPRTRARWSHRSSTGMYTYLVPIFTYLLPISIFDLRLSAIFGVISLIGAKSIFEKSNKDNILTARNFY